MIPGKSVIVLSCILITGMAILAGCVSEKSPASTIAVTPVPAPAGNNSLTPAGNNPVPIACNVPGPATVRENPAFGSLFTATELLTRPTGSSVMMSLVPKTDLAFSLVYGTSSGSYACQTPEILANAGTPANVTILGLLPDTRYYYRTCTSGSTGSSCGPEHTFQTRRYRGSTFTFDIQADSHPEREKTMFDAALYIRTLENVVQEHPDFYVSLGDDFSIDPLADKGQLSQAAVDNVYLGQRTYLGTVGSSSPVFLVNGNHEEAARYLLDGTADNAAVLAGTSRMKFFPQPVPDGFYTGDTGNVDYVGLPGDYYAWTWGDALFVVIDPYWHSSVAVDNVIGNDRTKKRNLWDVTLGDTQYQWFRKTLEESNAKYKFVFAHHVLGTGRGGIEDAGLYEWGGRNQKGAWEFDRMRPGWELPLQQLMAENNVTIFFQGHDHLFARQELDGVTYQEVPVPADPTYSIFNADAYRSGVILPNTGHLKVTVSPQNVTVDYVKSYLPGKETAAEKNGMVAYSYSLAGKNKGG